MTCGDAASERRPLERTVGAEIISAVGVLDDALLIVLRATHERTVMKRSGIILLVEDNPDDAELTLRAFERSKVANQIVVVRDGVEALDYLFLTGTHAGRDPEAAPEVVLLDLKLPKISGLDVLRRMRADERTRRLPVVVLTSSIEERDLIRSYDLGA